MLLNNKVTFKAFPSSKDKKLKWNFEKFRDRFYSLKKSYGKSVLKHCDQRLMEISAEYKKSAPNNLRMIIIIYLYIFVIYTIFKKQLKSLLTK